MGVGDCEDGWYTDLQTRKGFWFVEGVIQVWSMKVSASLQ